MRSFSSASFTKVFSSHCTIWGPYVLVKTASFPPCKINYSEDMNSRQAGSNLDASVRSRTPGVHYLEVSSAGPRLEFNPGWATWALLIAHGVSWLT